MAKDIKQIVISLAKSDAYFMYFLLESHEGICFYSTLPDQHLQTGLAKIELNFHPSTQNQVLHLLAQIQEQKIMEFSMEQTTIDQ